MDPSSLPSFTMDPPAPIHAPPIIPPVVSTPQPPTTVAGGGGGGVVPPSFNHPPYSDMICEAIGALKEKDGSSKRAIAKYIESAFKDLPPTHPALLTHHLKRLKNNGLLVMVKKSYKLASNARSEAAVPDSSPPNPPDASAGPKRGRGRPPKPKTAVPSTAGADSNSHLHQTATVPVSVPVEDGTKKSPGRPRKNVSTVAGGQLVARKGRGRPPKTGPKKSPGRPRKPKTVRSVVGVKRGRGRPPKNLIQMPQLSMMPTLGQPMAVPYADATAAAANNTVSLPSLPRPRGRPKGTGGGRAASAAASTAVSGGKRRGRPPKISGVAAKPNQPKKRTGNPVGRPKKTTGGGGADSKALQVAYGDLKRKLEFFQSKVKQAVGVLKTQFTSESNISAIGAIHELEGLAAMDIVSTQFREDAQQLMPAQPPPPPPPSSTQPPPVLQNEGYVQ